MPRTTLLGLLLALASGCRDASPEGGDATGGSTDDGSESGSDALDASGSTAGGDGSGGDSGDDTGGDSAGDTMGAAELTGEERFLQMCAPCHGNDAMGTELGYELRHPPREFATWVVRNGRPGEEFPMSAMSAYPPEAISDADLEAIFDFLDAFPQPDTPEGLYLDYCGNCHGPDALGGVVSKNISDQEAGDIHEKVREGESAGDPGARMLYMPEFEEGTLTDAEVDMIADFIAGL